MRVNWELWPALDDDAIAEGHILFSPTLGRVVGLRAAVYCDMGLFLALSFPSATLLIAKNFLGGALQNLPDN